DAPTQFIDVRDLAEWMVTLLERRIAGTFHATGPAEPLTLGRCLEPVAAAVGGDAKLTWGSGEVLRAHGNEPWREVPLWVDAADQAFETASIARALAEGLRFRPLEVTARDTLVWERGLITDPRPASPVLTAEREAEVLADWAATVRRR